MLGCMQILWRQDSHRLTKPYDRSHVFVGICLETQVFLGSLGLFSCWVQDKPGSVFVMRLHHTGLGSMMNKQMAHSRYLSVDYNSS